METLKSASGYLSVNPSLELKQKRSNHGEHGEHGDKRGKGFMEASFGISSDQFLPRVPRVPRGWTSF
jgi:hypothetical protein